MPTRGPLRTFFRQDAGYPEDEPDQTDALLDQMIRQSRGPGMPRPMPGPPPAARQMPQMRRQGWADVLGQALAGAGDVFSAGGGRQTNFLQQTMGRQEAMRAQAYQQALGHRAQMEHAERGAHEYDRWRYGAEQQERRQDFSEGQQRKQMDLYQKRFGKQDEEEKRRTQEGKINNYKNILGRVDGPKQLRLEAAKLRALSPADKDAIDAVEASLATVFKIDSEQPNKISEQIDESLGSKAGGGLRRQLRAMWEPQGDRGLPVFNAPRSYRLLYGTGLGAVPAGAMDMAEYFGLADFSGGPQGVGEGVHLKHGTEAEAEAEAEWRRILNREMWKSRQPQTPGAYPWGPQWAGQR